jgi:hypothetical protein
MVINMSGTRRKMIGVVVAILISPGPAGQRSRALRVPGPDRERRRAESMQPEFRQPDDAVEKPMSGRPGSQRRQGTLAMVGGLKTACRPPGFRRTDTMSA